MRMLTALKCVDWAVPFTEDTPQRLIARVLPDLLVKGGDYKPEQVAGYEEVTAAGGQVVILDFYDGYSTSRICSGLRFSELRCPYIAATRAKSLGSRKMAS